MRAKNVPFLRYLPSISEPGQVLREHYLLHLFSLDPTLYFTIVERFGLIAGIGMPNKHADIRLSNIVVNKPVEGDFKCTGTGMSWS